MEIIESKAISNILGYMYFANISIVNSGVHEANAHVYHLVIELMIYTSLYSNSATAIWPSDIFSRICD